ncbi:MAG TPA: protocatechuate 3,4-dioxygenase subunit alpha [Acidothermaceae bacterium]|nr:protocatechuate 3,4-dioxygenase subunit alpha [Acidothermaceae bacterium]
MSRRGLTPSQTVGPFLSIGLTWPDGADAVTPSTPGAFWVRGQLFDGTGAPVPDGLIETWQADPSGHFHHPDDPVGSHVDPPAGFRGFGRCATDADGRWAICVLKPGQVPASNGALQAPHLDVSVFARGLLDRVVTRIYFGDEIEANAADPVLRSVPEHRRGTLVADMTDDGYTFDIRLQGERETVFFDL